MNTKLIDKTLQKKSRIKILVIFAIFFIPLLAAFIWLQMVKSGINLGSTSKGDLIEPARPVQSFALSELSGDRFDESSINKIWTFLYFSKGMCDQACEKNIYHMRQIRLSLNKDMDRVQRVVVVRQFADLTQNQLQEHPGLRVLTGSREDIARLYDQVISAESPLPKTSDSLYLIDPFGNLMMRFPSDLNPKHMLDDIRHLLKVSRIG